MTAPRSLSFEGCRTRAEARERFQIWLAEIHADNLQKLRTDLFAARDDGELINDEPDEIITTVEDVVAEAREYWADNIADTMAQYDRIIAEHLRSDIP